ncbi:MAG: flagellar protein FlgN [Phycisphaerae bacterium]|nr:flagellar protein FlgN [Phycisphaerae bacterium]
MIDAPTNDERVSPAAIRSLAESISAELDAVRALAAAVDRQRSAVERTDAASLRTASEEVAQRSRRLAELARQRDRIATTLGLPIDQGMDAWIVRLRERGADAGAIEGVGALLRREASQTMRRVSIVRQAADRLAAHLAGVRALVHAPASATYGRRGRLASTDRSLAVDLRH